MRCHRAQKYISEYLDGALEARKVTRLERHLRHCEVCRGVLDDFRAIAGTAAKLDQPDPDDAVWLKIKARLVAGERAPAADAARAPRPWVVGGLAPASRFAAAAALALILVGTGLFIGLRAGRNGSAGRLGDPEKFTLAKLDEAEHFYQQAIKSLGEAFAAQKGGMVPQVAEMFEKNLQVVDATIQSCRAAVMKEPENLEARNYLMAAYMDKLNVLDTALDYHKKNVGAASRKTVL